MEGVPQRKDITDRLPRFRLIRSLAATHMSEVYLAEETTPDGEVRRVALKVVFPDNSRQPDLRERFRLECETLLKLRHPNIVPAYDAGESADGALCYLTMRYFDMDLRTWLKERGPLSARDTLSVARQVAAALDFAHQHNLVHRDVKPGNILVELAHKGTRRERIGRVYLSDFGVVKDSALPTLTTPGQAPYTPDYAAPEQVQAGGRVAPATDVHSLGRVIRQCLTGHHNEGFGAGKLLPDVNDVLRRATDEQPDKRYATCGELIEALETPIRAHRTRRLLAAVALPVAAAVMIAGIVLWNVFAGSAPAAPGPQAHRQQQQQQEQQPELPLNRVAGALRHDCQLADSPVSGATSTLSCQASDGQAAQVALFDDGSKAGRAYVSTVKAAGVDGAQGDCATASGAEHRYPVTGPARGRVLCYVRGGLAVVVWSDHESSTVTRVEAPAGEDAALRRSWAGWTDAYPTFPTPAERRLQEVAAGAKCTRVSAAGLDEFLSADAGVRCVPWGSGAQAVEYYQFSSPQELRQTLDHRVKEAKAPTRGSCASGKAPGFLGTQRHDWLRVDVGQVLCRPGAGGTLTMEWSMEPLLISGRVTGNEPAALAGWWSGWHLAPLSEIVGAMNEKSGFPTAAEARLLRHIPEASRKNCVRPSPEQAWQDIGAVSAVGVVCGRTSGAKLVAYYQFKDAATMRYAFNSSGSSDGPTCTSLPEDFEAERPYSRGGHTGVLRCGAVDGTGERYLEWTDDKLAIAAYAYGGAEPFVLIDWWTHDAGPA